MAETILRDPSLQLPPDLLPAWFDQVDARVSHGAARLARILASHIRRGGDVYRLRRTLADELRRNVRTITRYVRELVEAGLLWAAPRAPGRCNRFVLKLTNTDCDGQCPGGWTELSTREGDPKGDPVVVRGGSKTYEDVITYRCETGSEAASHDPTKAREFMRGNGRQEGASAARVDSAAAVTPCGWPERAEVAEHDRADTETVSHAARAYELPRRLALYLATRYSAGELSWLLDAASTARAPIACLRALARRLDAGEVGPGIDRRPPRPRKWPRRSLDLADLYRGAHSGPKPQRVAERPPTAELAAWWEALPDEERRRIDRGAFLGSAPPDETDRALAVRWDVGGA